MNVTTNLKTSTLPSKPGVYIFKNAQSQVIYIGKALNLKNRVKSYFQSSAQLSPWKQRLVNEIKNIDYILATSETEALLLECNLIKKYRPKYNVTFKDDKFYKFIKITLGEDFSRILTIRRISKDKARYFGPYSSSKSLDNTLRTLRKIFPYRTCKTFPEKPCLLYYINLCPAPCIGLISKKEYHKLIAQIILFLEGKSDEIIKDLKKEMEKLAQKREFEKAAEIRDRLIKIQKTLATQQVISVGKIDQDIISMARENDLSSINLFMIRQGKLIDKQNFILKHTRHLLDKEILTSFVKQYCRSATNLPKEIIIQTEIEDKKNIVKWLESLVQRKMKLTIPKRGQKRRLIKLGRVNAKEYLKAKERKEKINKTKAREAQLELKSRLNLKKIPKVIECFDVSNIQGREATGSMVVFVSGKPDKSRYRKFKIRTVAQINDYAMMEEVLKRRLTYIKNTQRSKSSKDNAFKTPPDLIIIDGGKGQLNRALEVLKQFKLKIPVIGLAKRLEEIYVPNKSKPFHLPPNSPALLMLRHIRDEAHRFAITYHRKLREKKETLSILDQIPGIGPKKKKALLERFGSVDGIKKANLSKLSRIISKKTARALKEILK